MFNNVSHLGKYIFVLHWAITFNISLQQVNKVNTSKTLSKIEF